VAGTAASAVGALMRLPWAAAVAAAAAAVALVAVALALRVARPSSAA
jgi:hypothetical protein